MRLNRKQSLAGKIGEKIADVAVILFAVFPIFLLIITSFKYEREVYTTIFNFTPTLQAYKAVIGLGVIPSFFNSLIIATTTSLICIPIALFSAFAFSRIKFRFSNALLTYIITCKFLPPVCMVIPYFMCMRALHLTDTRFGLIIVNLSTALPYAIWLLQGFVDAVPRDMEEAAYIDGCGKVGAILNVTMPMVMPGIITSFVMIFIQTWNEFLFALVMTSKNVKTLSIVLQSTNTSNGLFFSWMSAVAAFVIIPVIFITIPIRNHFINGMNEGGVKG